ncbi:type I-E CRISPR-associated protein Cse1/CasA [Streptomyces sp. NPDC001108]
MTTSPPAYNLLIQPWIPVADTSTGARSVVGIAEALTLAHQLRLDLTRGRIEHIAVLRLLAAVYDAAAGPSSTTEWDATYTAPELPAARIAAYLDRWADKFDLFGAAHPFGQCGHLTEPNRTSHALDPASFGGAGITHFAHQLRGAAPPLDAATAATALLVLQLWSPGGIQSAHPTDPRARNGKLYGSKTGPLGTATHLYLTHHDATLKDQLLLNLPPQPRIPGDAPAWERPCPPAAGQERDPAGRLDYLTWPTRRLRLDADTKGRVTGLAVLDGDRTNPRAAALAHDPMAAHTETGAQLPLHDRDRLLMPWAAATMLDTGTSPALAHVLGAAERGALPPGLHLHAHCTGTAHTTVHLSAISDIAHQSTPLGPVSTLATPAGRTRLANAARLAGSLQRVLDTQMKAARRASSGLLPRGFTLATDPSLDGAWHRLATSPGHDLTQWAAALADAAERTGARFSVAGPSAAARFHVSFDRAVQQHLAAHLVRPEGAAD